MQWLKRPDCYDSIFLRKLYFDDIFKAWAFKMLWWYLPIRKAFFGEILKHEHLALCCWRLIWSFQNDEKKPEKWLKPWHIGTHLWVPSKYHPMNTNMTGFRWVSNVLRFCALDKSSLSIGRVKTTWLLRWYLLYVRRKAYLGKILKRVAQNTTWQLWSWYLPLKAYFGEILKTKCQ